MRHGFLVLVAPVVFASGCAHQALSPSDLREVQVPAFISRIEEDAGPRSRVFRDDDTWSPKLKKLPPKEADRRLAAKLEQAMKRFEIAERLRASTQAQLPAGPPWARALDPVAVSTALQNFLVQEVPANAPDYDLVAELGADAVVEFVVEEYGMRSEDGRAQVYLLGYGRMFDLAGGGEVWRRNFVVDLVDEAAFPALDPFRVAKEEAEGFPSYRGAMEVMLDAVAKQFAQDLTPQDAGARDAQEAPRRSGPEVDPQGDELPDPDPI